MSMTLKLMLMHYIMHLKHLQVPVRCYIPEFNLNVSSALGHQLTLHNMVIP